MKVKVVTQDTYVFETGDLGYKLIEQLLSKEGTMLGETDFSLYDLADPTTVVVSVEEA